MTPTVLDLLREIVVVRHDMYERVKELASSSADERAEAYLALLRARLEYRVELDRVEAQLEKRSLPR